MKPGSNPTPLLAVLGDPQRMTQLTPADWDLLVRQARQAGLLGRLHARAQMLGLLPALPAGPATHLAAAARHASAQADEARREVAHVRQALSALGAPVILLKGAAYLIAGLPPAQGRSFTDIDILVPKAVLAEAESALLFHGWVTTHHDPYDQRYYREWMHELPPMEHVRRGTVLDVHHNILPETARMRPRADLLIERAQPLADHPGLYVLAPEDMLLHSMVHLLHNEEMNRGLRDLSDLDLLIREFALQPGFWDRLPARAMELGVQRVLFHGLTQVQSLLATPVPPSVIACLQAPSPPMRQVMNAVWRRALGPLHPSARPPLTGMALAAVFLHAHWMRMPMPLLMRHLSVKAWRTLKPKRPDQSAAP